MDREASLASLGQQLVALRQGDLPLVEHQVHRGLTSEANHPNKQYRVTASHQVAAVYLQLVFVPVSDKS